MANASTPVIRTSGALLNLRWIQLLIGIIGMVAIANLQYGWTMFVDPINEKFKFGRVGIQFAFTIFVFCETWLVPIEGYLVDRFGPRWIVAIGGVLVGLGWIINASADTLGLLYLGAIAGGAGAGIVYGTSVGNALKWFPDRRGLAAGLTAAAFGAGSAATVVPISNMILTQGYQAAFFSFGIAQGLVVLFCALLLRAPGPDHAPAGATGQSQQGGKDFTWQEMLQTPAFWLLYVMMTMLAMGGIMATAQLAPMARDFKVANVPVSIFGVTVIAVQFALQLDRILNGLTRPFFGWVSDHIGRENTMFIAFTLEGIAIFLLLTFAAHPLWFAILSGLTFFAWGEIYSLFPALCGDLFGRKFATVNYGLLYTAKGTATLLVPFGSYLYTLTQSWWPIFGLAIVFDWTGALLALLVLKPLCTRWRASQQGQRTAVR